MPMSMDSDPATVSESVLAMSLREPEQQVHLHVIVVFISILKRLWHHLVFEDKVPPFLDTVVVTFLLLALQPLANNLSAEAVQSMWRSLATQIPTWTGPIVDSETDDAFRLHGELCSLGAEMLYPPYRRCPRLDSGCREKILGNAQRTFCRIYTMRRGILPAYDVSLYCYNCHTRYHYAYFVQNPGNPDAIREYYDNLLPYIQAQETSFLEDKLCEYFEQYICLSHTSTGNLARMYNANLGKTEIMMVEITLLAEIGQSTILDGFFMHALLRRAARHRVPLTLPHNTHHEHRFDDAMEIYNRKMAGTGQPQYFHACHDCMKFFEREDGTLYYVRGGTTDGVTLGHPCCRIKNCQNRLQSTKDFWCIEHRASALLCRIDSCERTAVENFLTCDIQEHRMQELKVQEEHQSAFKDLRRRIKKDNVPTTSSRHRASLDSSNFIFDEEPEDTRARNNKKPRLQTARRWTHNEQLFVLCCGIIVARATFFTSEGVASVKDFLKKIFPHPWLLPTHVFYDKACLLLRHLRAQRDQFFNLVRLVVDVFHARNHHKEEDSFCNDHNNPALFPELRTTRKGKPQWTLNSSNAEQINVWFGAFQAITREMSEPRYNFFLDEMILIRNEWLVGELEHNGKQPFLQSEEDMKREWTEMYLGQASDSEIQ